MEDKIRYQYFAGQWVGCTKEEYERLNNYVIREMDTRIRNSHDDCCTDCGEELANWEIYENMDICYECYEIRQKV